MKYINLLYANILDKKFTAAFESSSIDARFAASKIKRAAQNLCSRGRRGLVMRGGGKARARRRRRVHAVCVVSKSFLSLIKSRH